MTTIISYASQLYPLNDEMSTHLKLCLADTIHSFKWEEIICKLKYFQILLTRDIFYFQRWNLKQ